MRCLILTAGLGTRLRPLTFVRAKAAVPVNGEPIARRVIAWLVSQGLTDLVLNLHHRPESIAAVVGDGRDLGARVRYSWENPVLGSAGGPRRALRLLVEPAAPGAREQPSFVIVNGDTLTSLPLGAMIAAHQASGALVTMALIPNPRPDLYGGVRVEGGWVTSFTRRGVTQQSYHFIGVQVVNASVFAPLADGVPAETVMQLYPELLGSRGDAIAAHIVDAPFQDVGNPAEYLQTSLDLAAVEGDRLVSAVDVIIDPAARVSRTAVWNHVRISARAALEDCIVCDRVQVPEGATYRRCAIAPNRGETLREDEYVEGDLVIRRF